jgi:predicted Fe-Mo cluster-binding NifX family protein
MSRQEDDPMRIAIPLAAGRLCQHFGHCEQFALVEVDPDQRTVLGREDLTPPAHQPGILPPWLAEKGASLVIAGGMGQRAQAIFQQHGVDVIVGAAAEEPENLTRQWLAGELAAGPNACDH